MRKVVHVDMDAFYASVEQRDKPELRGKPVIVAWQAKRSVVCAASYEARAFGVRSAMPAVQAERLCPEATFAPPDFPRYRMVSNQVREIVKRHTEQIEPVSLDEAYLDVTENKMGLVTATLVARTIREQIRQELALTASVGVAPNKFLAKLASDWRKPDGLFVVQPAEIDTFLLPLPVGTIAWGRQSDRRGLPLSNAHGGMTIVSEPKSPIELQKKLVSLSMLGKYKSKADIWLGLGCLVTSDRLVDAMVFSKEPWKPDHELEKLSKLLRGKPMLPSGKKVGRNQPCPCGSGKKYKHCHGAS